MSEISTAAGTRIIKNAGAERVGEYSSEILLEFLEEIGTRIAAIAVRRAKDQGRRSVRAEDILAAIGTERNVLKEAKEKLYKKAKR